MADSVYPSLRRVGLLAHGFASWGGGVDFLRLVASSLREADEDLELHVLAPMKGPLKFARDLRNLIRHKFWLPIPQSKAPNLEHLKAAFMDCGAKLHLIDIGQRAITQASSRLYLDALIPAMAPRTMSSLPWVGYIYDFQHKHLPHFFSAEERTKRDHEFAQMLENATAVIVNARDVANDIKRYYPNSRAKIFVLPFSPAPRADSFSVDPQDARNRYQICSPYFIVCNQFWKHKDHRTVFKAFAAVAGGATQLTLVCTGATTDYRFAGYFENLMQEAAILGVADRIKILGLISKRDQMALMRGAIALVQPTLFEGGPGGGAVYDAVAVGQRCIVSDISVNSEIDDPKVTFFEAGNAESLANHMNMVLAELPEILIQQDELVAQGKTRLRECGKKLLEAIDFARSC